MNAPVTAILPPRAWDSVLLVHPARASTPLVVGLMAWSLYCVILIVLSIAGVWPFMLETGTSQLVM